MTKPADERTAKARERIEGMYQRAMDFRDSTPVRDGWQKNEEQYRRSYMNAYKRTLDVEAFKKSTRQYRRFLRDGI